MVFKVKSPQDGRRLAHKSHSSATRQRFRSSPMHLNLELAPEIFVVFAPKPSPRPDCYDSGLKSLESSKVELLHGVERPKWATFWILSG